MTRFEIGTFADGRLKLLVRFFLASNFRINENGEATWVPTLDETELLVQTLAMANFYNLNKEKIRGFGKTLPDDHGYN